MTLLQRGYGKHLLHHCHYKDISAMYIYMSDIKGLLKEQHHSMPSPLLSPCWGCKDAVPTSGWKAELEDGSLHMHVPWGQHGGFRKAQHGNPACLSHPAEFASLQQT